MKTIRQAGNQWELEGDLSPLLAGSFDCPDTERGNIANALEDWVRSYAEYCANASHLNDNMDAAKMFVKIRIAIDHAISLRSTS